jgi:small subunit ribosomal protein S20
MANTKSAIKNARKNLRRKAENQRIKTRLKTLAKRAKATATGGDATAAKEAARAYVSALDKAAKNGIIHKNSANRHKAACASVLSA